jgi:hypothetical protein
MRIRPAPATATWLLKLFCAHAEDESLIGDLIEQYQHGRGRLWYWRQISFIVLVRSYRKVRRVSLSAISMKQISVVILLAAAFAAVLLTDIWLLFLIGILGGIIVGTLTSLIGSGMEQTKLDTKTTPDPLTHRGISISHIPVEGTAGLLFVFATIFIFVVGIPAVREMVLFTAPLGILALGILHYWHRRHSVGIEPLNLHEQKH